MMHNEYEQIAFYREPPTYKKTGKFLVKMISNVTGKEKVQYKKYKCRKGWDKNNFNCWGFSKQGAEQIIENLKKEYKINYEKGLIKFEIEEQWEEV